MQHRGGVGLSLGKCVPADDGLHVFSQTGALKQRHGKLGIFVGHHGHAHTHRLQPI